MKIRIHGFSAALAVSSLALIGIVTPAAAYIVDDLMREMAKRPTPKLPDGRPDLNGLWFSYTGAVPAEFSADRLADGSLQSHRDSGAAAFQAAFKPTENPPKYKPEAMAKVKELQAGNLNRSDKVFLCGHPGLPRIGAPQQIVQQNNQIVFLYSDIAGMVFRVIPIGGTHRDTDGSYYGVSVGRWEGDTLVVDTRNFSTNTWLGEEGFIHSDQMRTIERLRRIGDTIEYRITVEDPGVLTEPWVKPTYTMRKTDAVLTEPYPCDFTNTSGIDERRHDQRAK